MSTIKHPWGQFSNEKVGASRMSYPGRWRLSSDLIMIVKHDWCSQLEEERKGCFKVEMHHSPLQRPAGCSLSAQEMTQVPSANNRRHWSGSQGEHWSLCVCPCQRKGLDDRYVGSFWITLSGGHICYRLWEHCLLIKDILLIHQAVSDFLEIMCVCLCVCVSVCSHTCMCQKYQGIYEYCTDVCMCILVS